MEPIYADLSIRQNGRTMKTKAAKMRFCPNLCFTYQNSDQEQACYKVLGEFLLSKKEGLALYGQTPFLDEILKAVPELTSAITCVISDAPRQIEGLKVVPLHEIPSIVKTVFLCDKLSLDLSRMTKKINTLNKNIDIVTPHILPQLNDSVIPQQGWIFDSESIYPIDIPEVEFEKTDTNPETVFKNVETITKIIEHYICQYPHEWGGWMHNRWKARTRAEQVMIDRLTGKV